ncbi:hypothetical protein OEA41_006576 [Lepraria neglecta]|uniref:tetrahydrofolate synthase n=1 Tax=Lepraria neglecta TaxID=209136 RepID=A0AAE0DKC7_9LECA|nr:hypothetical protein OEA41_006576 [Lepraria neglecta]
MPATMDKPSIINKYRPDLASFEEVYCDIHWNLELSRQEVRTANIAASNLEGLDDFEVQRGVGGHDVVGVLRNGPGSTILLRADTDALSHLEKTKLEYASTKVAKDHQGNETPLMHASGRGNSWRSSSQVDDGLYDTQKRGIPIPNVVLAQHDIALKAGAVALSEGAILPAFDSFEVRIFGKSGHISRPDLCVDPIVTASHIIVRLQTLITKEVRPEDFAVIGCASIHGRSAPNIIPDCVDIKISIRTYRPRTQCETSGSLQIKEPSFKDIMHAPPTINDPKNTAIVKDAFNQYFGDDSIHLDPLGPSEVCSVLSTACGAPLDQDINNLNVVHIAGTKGKGSTCAFVSSFLKAHGERTGFPRKVGLYTSPHLKYVQERVQINSKPLSETSFAKYIFEVWDKLSSSDSAKPRYLQLLFLVSVHAFIKEGVDAAVFETHNGGEYDATNAIEKSIVSGITPIGMDHIEQLGPTIRNIAWHKAGIFRKGALAFSASQEPEVAEVLSRRAKEKEAGLTYVTDIDPALPANAPALKPEVQKMNASLALALSNGFLKSKLPKELSGLTSVDVARGVEQFFWLGRYQQIVSGTCQWFLDGAHNDLSVHKAAQWFAEAATEIQSTTSNPRILIFSHISDRDGAGLLRLIAKTLQERDRCFEHPEKNFPLELQNEYIEAWKSVYGEGHAAFESSIEGALNLAKKIGEEQGGMQTLITGSLYLIGGALRLLEPRPKAV